MEECDGRENGFTCHLETSIEALLMPLGNEDGLSNVSGEEETPKAFR